MSKKQNLKKIHLGLLFFIGLGLFIFGILGYIFRLFTWVPVAIDEVLPQETSFLVKIQIDEIQEQRDFLNIKEFSNRLDQYLSQKFNLNFTQDIKPWVGRQVSFAILKNGEKVWALEYRSKKEALKFLQNFTTENEGFIEQKYDDGKLFTPKFSSNITFGFYHNWLLISPDRSAIQNIFTKTTDLKQNKKYKKIITDIPSKNFIFIFGDTLSVLNNIEIPQNYLKYKPLITTLAQSLPTLGLSLQKENKEITLTTKILAQKGIFEDRLIPKIPNKNMPQLASMVPKNVLFFINGSDLYAKYLHTKKFLSDLEPQFPIIFNGLLQAQSQKIFGEDFDFETDFLSKMRGQYAFVLDFDNPLKPFVNFTFITGFGSGKKQTYISDIHEAIHVAQTQFSPIIKEVKLPDGSIRKELVSAKPEDVPILKQSFENHEYFTTKKTNTTKQFTYGFLDEKFVFTTQEDGMKSIISVIEKKKTSLSENSDFRESVLFKFSPSQSYGFLNLAKITPIIEMWNEKADTSFLNFIQSKFRNLTFSRKVFPGEIFLKVILFQR